MFIGRTAMTNSDYYIELQQVRKQLATVTRALADCQTALDTEKAMRALEKKQNTVADAFFAGDRRDGHD